jgi:integrase/recombinase XerD
VANKGMKLDGEYYEETEVRAILSTCSKRSPTGIRDRAYLLLLWQAGLRSFEAIDLLLSDIDFERATIHVRDGKGGYSGTVACGAEALEAVERWLDVKSKLGIGDVVNPRVSRRKANVGEVVYPDALPFIFTTLSTGRTVAERDMRQMFKRRAEKAGLKRRAHLHGLRHSHAVALDRAGTSVSVTSSQLRHKSLAITTAYLNHISADQKVAAVAGVFG